MTRSDVRGSNNNEQGFYGRDLLYRVRSGNLDREANDGTDRYVEKNSKPILVTLGSIFAVAIVALAISGLVGMSLHSLTPAKLPMDNVQDIETIHDDAMLLQDQDMVNAKLTEFRDLTGICPVVYTAYDEDWQEMFPSLEIYAEYLYYSNYNDLQHFVIVFSIPGSDAGMTARGEKPHYAFEIHQGKSTEAILGSILVGKFKSNIIENISNGSGFDGAVVNSMEMVRADAYGRMNPSTARRAVNLGIAFLPMVITVVFFTVWIVRVIRKYVRERKVERLAAVKKG